MQKVIPLMLLPTWEVVEDLIQIVTVFSCKLQGGRANKGIDVLPEPVELTGESIGIDVGIKDLAICSNIEKPYKNINRNKNVKKLEKKMRRLQRKVTNKYEKNKEGRSYVKTSNIKKLEKNIRKLHKRLDNIRTDNRQKVTTEIAKTKPSLSERVFVCDNCGAVIDRDKNASINLSRYKVS